jgi:hypothetical protein
MTTEDLIAPEVSVPAIMHRVKTRGKCVRNKVWGNDYCFRRKLFDKRFKLAIQARSSYVPDEEKAALDSAEHTSLHQPAEVTKHGLVLILPPAVVQLHVEDRWELATALLCLEQPPGNIASVFLRVTVRCTSYSSCLNGGRGKSFKYIWLKFIPVKACHCQVGIVWEVVVGQEVHAARPRDANVGNDRRDVVLTLYALAGVVEPRKGSLLLVHAVHLHIYVPEVEKTR